VVLHEGGIETVRGYRGVGSQFCDLSSGFWVLGSGFWVLGSGFWLPRSGFCVVGFAFWVVLGKEINEWGMIWTELEGVCKA
jgi:hypothetical protein